jgi:hypothetical protein
VLSRPLSLRAVGWWNLLRLFRLCRFTRLPPSAEIVNHRTTPTYVVFADCNVTPRDEMLHRLWHIKSKIQKVMYALVAQGLERSIADRQVPRSNRGQSFFY